HDRDALADRLAVERLRDLVRRHVGFALVEHAHVTAQRQRRNDILGSVAALARPQRLAESDREAQHAHAAAAGDPVMAGFVEGHQQPEADDHPPDRTEETAHASAPAAMRRLAWSRAAASAASSASIEPAAPPATAARQSSTSAGIPRKAIRP